MKLFNSMTLMLNNQGIFKRGYDLVKQKQITFAWVNDGHVLIKKIKTGWTYLVHSL